MLVKNIRMPKKTLKTGRIDKPTWWT